MRLEAANVVCDAILMKFTAQLGNRNVVVLAGADWQGVEYYDANRGFQATMNPFGNPFSGGGEEPKGFLQGWLQGGVVGQMQRNRNAARQAQRLPEPHERRMVGGGSRRQHVRRALRENRGVRCDGGSCVPEPLQGYHRRIRQCGGS